MKINVKVVGLDKVMNDFTERGLKARKNVDHVSETYARKMANQAGEDAPVKDNVLRPNIIASPRRVEEGTWEFGSNLPYARRQEYENRTHKGFIRRAVWNNRTDYRKSIRRVITLE